MCIWEFSNAIKRNAFDVIEAIKACLNATNGITRTNTQIACSYFSPLLVAIPRFIHYIISFFQFLRIRTYKNLVYQFSKLNNSILRVND